MNTVRAFYWEKDYLQLLDQTKLPHLVTYIKCQSYEEVARAIEDMKVRGAPAIGAVAAYGLVLAAKQAEQEPKRIDVYVYLEKARNRLLATRPTAVNLRWALDLIANVTREYRRDYANEKTTGSIFEKLLTAAHQIVTSELRDNCLIGSYGKELIPSKAKILTHCNAGALATSGYGTALGVVRAAHAAGKEVEVFATETRPFFQGARLTAWELMQEEIPVTLLTDSMGGYLMKKKDIDLVIVGADRIAANGDVANKIGTYMLAVLAKEHGIPFYVAAPRATIDLSVLEGHQIPVEKRPAEELTHLHNIAIAPSGVKVWNPGFDITPHKYITALITESGILKPPYVRTLRQVFHQEEEGW